MKDAAILQGFERLSSLVNASLAVVGDGRAVDFVGLEKDAENLCAKLRRARPETAAELMPRLISLIDDMDKLKAALLDQRDVLAREIAKLDYGRRAARAYRPR
jgi:hypothetical protein